MKQNKSFLLLLKIALVYAGTVIGAGFASGQELMQFFMVFGSKGLWGIGLATVLFIYLGALIMFLSTKLRTANYIELLQSLMGKRAARLMDLLTLIMLPGGLVVMLAGSGAVFAEQLGLPNWQGTMLAVLITCIVLVKGLPGILNFNLVLVPIKILVLAVVSFLAIHHQGGLPRPFPELLEYKRVAANWGWSSILYVSYNMVVPVALLSSLGRTVPFKTGVAGGALGGLILGVTAGMITLAGLSFYPAVLNCQVPVLFISRSAGFILQFVLGVLIWIAMLTTTIADAHGLASRLAPGEGLGYKVVGIGATLLSIPLAGLNFNFLVRLLYPIFGYAGLILLLALLVAPFRKLRMN